MLDFQGTLHFFLLLFFLFISSCLIAACQYATEVGLRSRCERVLPRAVYSWNGALLVRCDKPGRRDFRLIFVPWLGFIELLGSLSGAGRGGVWNGACNVKGLACFRASLDMTPTRVGACDRCREALLGPEGSAASKRASVALPARQARARWGFDERQPLVGGSGRGRG